MVDGILYCLNLNLFMHFRVVSRRPVTFKTKLSVTTVNNSFWLYISCFLPLRAPFQMLHRDWIEYCNIHKNFNWYRGSLAHNPVQPWGNVKKSLLEVFCIKLSFLHLISNGLNWVSINLLMQIVALL